MQPSNERVPVYRSREQSDVHNWEYDREISFPTHPSAEDDDHHADKMRPSLGLTWCLVGSVLLWLVAGYVLLILLPAHLVPKLAHAKMGAAQGVR